MWGLYHWDKESPLKTYNTEEEAKSAEKYHNRSQQTCAYSAKPISEKDK